MTDVFISWSGIKSRKLAEALREWIPSVLQFAKPYYTPNDIEKGAKWSSEIAGKLASCKVGIVCLTADNHQKPWILFEAGALAKDLKDSKVCSILFDMDSADLSGPLATLQTTIFEKNDFRKLMASINGAGGERALPKDTFETVFDMWWPKLEKEIQSILAKEKKESSSHIRTDRELLEEILILSRDTSRSAETKGLEPYPPGLIRDLVVTCDTALEVYENNSEYGKFADRLIRLTSYIVQTSGRSDEFQDDIDRFMDRYDNIIPF